MQKMRELDQPAVESMDAPVAECPPAMGPSEPPMGMEKPDAPPPSMSLNLNAQGMDNIESLMKLMTKVNPDMINQPTGGMPPMSGMSDMPSLTPPGPSISMGNLDSGPLKMLPDFDADNDKMPGGEKDMMSVPDEIDGEEDGEEDNDKEKEAAMSMDDESEEEAFGNSVDDSEPEYHGIDAAVPNGDDLHKQKSMHRAAAGGDNPMKAESGDLRAQIRAELLQRLAEAKGEK